MQASVNRIRNAGFSEGRTAPRGWVWEQAGEGMRWRRGLPGRAADTGGMTIVSDRKKGRAFWSQVVVCKPGEFYRVEATATCDLRVGDAFASYEAAGFVIAVQPVTDSGYTGRKVATKYSERVTPGLQRAAEPIAVRTYYMVPTDVRRLRISVGVVDARGTACIHHVRFIQILEPEETSHILAIPPPSHALPAPCAAGSVCVCSRAATDRPITRLLAVYFGESQVRTAIPAELRAKQISADALLLPDAEPPSWIRSVTGLTKLAADRIVVIALPAFAKLTGGLLSLRRVMQDDDPIGAKITFGNYATCGFALADVFAYAWPGKRAGSFVQNHFRKTDALKTFCAKHGFVTLLGSMCDQDVTSGRPICLYKETSGGGLFVLDIEPAEAEESTFGEPVLAMYLLLSILGGGRNGLGRFVVPARDESGFRELIREAAVRFEPFVVHDADAPTEEITEQVVTIGREDQAYGLSLEPRPAILVRSGLYSGDVESVYGAFVWFKQLVRMEPYICPYAQRLTSQFRLVWIPCLAPWEFRDGWQRSCGPPVSNRCHLGEDRALKAPPSVLIDVVSYPINRVRVVIPKAGGDYHRYVSWLPQLWSAFAPGPYFAAGVDDGDTFHDRDRFAWRQSRFNVQVVVDDKALTSEAHRSVISAGGQVIRIEVPGSDADFTAHSIQRTDLTATLLEQVIGLQFGLIAVNRTPTPVHLDGFLPVDPGEALVIDRRDPILRAEASQAG